MLEVQIHVPVDHDSSRCSTAVVVVTGGRKSLSQVALPLPQKTKGAPASAGLRMQLSDKNRLTTCTQVLACCMSQVS